MQRRCVLGLILAVFGLTSLLEAAEKQDPNGNWKWKVSVRDQDFELTLKLKLEKDELTGTVSGPGGNDLKIEKATFKDDEVAFTVTFEFNGNKLPVKYKGKVDGDSIKGKAEFQRNGETMTVDWEPKREKEKK